VSAFILLGLVIVTLLTGAIVGERVINGQNAVATLPGEDPAAAAFVSYKMAVQAFVARNPGFAGSVALSDLGLQASASFLTNAANDVRLVAGGTGITVWEPGTSTFLSEVAASAEGDVAIGTSDGTNWTTPVLGQMGPLPVTVPEGDIVSFITYSGSGF